MAICGLLHFTYLAYRNGRRSPFKEVTKALQLAIACSYWVSSHERIESQYTVWENEIDGLLLLAVLHSSLHRSGVSSVGV